MEQQKKIYENIVLDNYELKMLALADRKGYSDADKEDIHSIFRNAIREAVLVGADFETGFELAKKEVGSFFVATDRIRRELMEGSKGEDAFISLDFSPAAELSEEESPAIFMKIFDTLNSQDSGILLEFISKGLYDIDEGELLDVVNTLCTLIGEENEALAAKTHENFMLLIETAKSQAELSEKSTKKVKSKKIKLDETELVDCPDFSSQVTSECSPFFVEDKASVSLSEASGLKHGFISEITQRFTEILEKTFKTLSGADQLAIHLGAADVTANAGNAVYEDAVNRWCEEIKRYSTPLAKSMLASLYPEYKKVCSSRVKRVKGCVPTNM